MSKKKAPNIPGYRIEKVLGEGGMGTVYLAVQTALERKVALKITLPALAEMDPSFTRRFVREARATAAIHHQNVITVFDAGEFEQSSYMAMEYISTGTLADLDEKKLTQEKICQLFIGICSGLDAAHKAGFVHRDIKPDNILINPNGVPIVTDFGIVKSLGTKNTAITIAGGTIGTPQYMSPEQIKAEELDGRSDLYSIGVMLFNLLEGHAPFVDPTPSAVYIMHVTTDPPPLSKQSHAFQEIITCLLQKNPDNRYKDANQLIKALKELKAKLANGGERLKIDQAHMEDVTEVYLDDDLDVPSMPAAKRKKVKPTKAKAKKKSQKTKINNETQVNVSKTPRVTRRYVGEIAQEPKSNSRQQNNHKGKTKLIAISAAVLLFVAGFFAYTQYEKNQSNTSNIIAKIPIENTEENKTQKDQKLADQKLADQKDWIQAQKDNNQQSYTQYIDDHSDGSYLDQARVNLKTIRDKLKSDIAEKEKQLSELVVQNNTKEKAQQLPEKEIQGNAKETERGTQIISVVAKTNEQDRPVIKNEELPKTQTVETKAIAQFESDSQTQVNELLVLAKSDLEQWNLMSPIGKNANARYNQILTIDEQNIEAKQGILEIIYKYSILANSKSNTNKFKEARSYINNAIALRNNYLSKAYDKNELYGTSQVVTIINLEKQKEKINQASKNYVTKQTQLAASLNNKQNKEVYYNDGLSAYKNKDYSEALDLFKKAAELGHARAQTRLADIYYAGQGVSQNDKLAVEWYKKAANQGDQIAQTYLGKMYEQGSGVSQNSSTAVDWYTQAAKQDHAEAQYLLGLSFYNGNGVTQSDSNAFKWYRLAASQKSAKAQNNLGDMYYRGKGTDKNLEKALEWYQKSANQNQPEAQNSLGRMYLIGAGVKKDFDKSFVWYKKSAEQGYADAQGLLGAMYEYGRGVRKSSSQAVKWYKSAAKQGNKFAIKKLNKRGISKSRYDD